MTFSRRIQVSFFYMIVILTVIGCSPQINEVIVGEAFLSKTLFYQAPMTAITYIIQGNIDPQPGPEIGIFDQLSLHIVSREFGTIKSKVKLNWTSGIWKPSIIYTDKTGHFEIMVRGDSVGDVGLLDQHGNVIWIYKPVSNLIVNSMAAGDLDRDGTLEFYVATNNGLHKLNHLGERVWQKSDWVYDVEVFDLGKDENPLVITTHHDGHIQFRDFKGKLVRDVKPQIKVHDIELIEWPTPWHILTRSNSRIFVLNFEGKVVFEHELKQFLSLNNYNIFIIRGTTVSFYDDQRPYLAVIAKFRASSGKSMLCIFSPDGKLVYKELLNVTTGLSAIQSPSSKSEMLLVGDGPGKVYKYQLNGS